MRTFSARSLAVKCHQKTIQVPRWGQWRAAPSITWHPPAPHSIPAQNMACIKTQLRHLSTGNKDRLDLQEAQSQRGAEKYTLIYKLPAIKLLRALSRLKLLQTGITTALLPAVCYLYLEGQVSSSLLTYTAGIASFAAVMLYSMSHYLRRVIGMMYLSDSRATLKVSHLTFWGRRHDLYLPVSEVMTLGDTGDSRNETLLQLRLSKHCDVLYFSTRLGQVVDRERFAEVFGSVP
ncbi:transmembrane protein 186-like isoform X2 [Polyodon spathula]|nr:transmembrane protein 186-like isoform X2 [Polyodon spathula]